MTTESTRQLRYRETPHRIGTTVPTNLCWPRSHRRLAVWEKASSGMAGHAVIAAIGTRASTPISELGTHQDRGHAWRDTHRRGHPIACPDAFFRASGYFPRCRSSARPDEPTMMATDSPSPRRPWPSCLTWAMNATYDTRPNLRRTSVRSTSAQRPARPSRRARLCEDASRLLIQKLRKICFQYTTGGAGVTGPFFHQRYR